jgi:uncharacterized MAPEG superfamily protein
MALPTLPFSTPVLLLGSIAAASALIYLPLVLVAIGRAQIGMEAIATPRAVVDKLSPPAQRATWAHANGFETFSVYAAAALVAYVTGVQSPEAGWAAIAFVAARTFYPLFYIANIPAGRALCFVIGSICTFNLFVAGLQAASAVR